MSYKKLSPYQVKNKVLLTLTKFVIFEPKEAQRLTEIIQPRAFIEMVLVGDKYGQ